MASLPFQYGSAEFSVCSQHHSAWVVSGCCRLAGLNVVLISRTQQKLEDIASEIATKYKVETKIVAADLGQPGDEKWEKIASTISKLDIGLLINNAGRSYDHAEYFDAVEQDLINSIIEINIQSVNKVRIDVSPKDLQTVRWLGSQKPRYTYQEVVSFKLGSFVFIQATRNGILVITVCIQLLPSIKKEANKVSVYLEEASATKGVPDSIGTGNRAVLRQI